MEQQNKYFTPEISDIRVGYECEYIQGTQFEPCKIIDVSTSILAIETGLIRVPYLTVDQIIDEGWEFVEKDWYKRYDAFLLWRAYSFQKGNYFLVFNPIEYRIRLIYRDPSIESEKNGAVQMNPERFHFNCECKDINTFRYICKLLKIK